MLTVVCLFVAGEYPYTAEYVTRLHAMVTRWIDRPFKFVVLTDQPWLFTSPIETVPIVRLAGFAYWTKLELFNPARQWSGRVLYLDLDVLIVAPLAPIVDVAADFAITDDPGVARQQRMRDSYGRQIVRRFNSSVMVWDGDVAKYTKLYANWTPATAARLSGDQCWIGEQLPLAETMDRAWFPRLSELNGKPPQPPAKVVLCKVPKNIIARQLHPWIAPLWGAA